jgi:hypothetical protein
MKSFYDLICVFFLGILGGFLSILLPCTPFVMALLCGMIAGLFWSVIDPFGVNR